MPDRVYIFANGEVNDLEAVSALIRPGDALISADGGIRHLTALGLTPSVLLGDLDSSPALQAASLEGGGTLVIQHPAEKDETDLELALRWAVEQGYQAIRVVGALGGRLDHSLANLFLLANPGLSQRDVRLEDGDREVFLISREAKILGQAGDLVSLLPLHGEARGVVTGGLYYPLTGETLLPYRTRGISNVMLGEEAHVSVDEGLLLCVHTRGVPETAGGIGNSDG